MSAIFARWGGPAGAAGGVLFSIWGYVHRDGAPSPFVAISGALAFVVPLLFLVALAGLYAGGRAKTGWLGGLGLVLGSIGCARGVLDAVAGDLSGRLYAAGLGWAAPLLEWLFLLLVGLTLMGVAATRGAALGTWSFLPLVVGLFGFAYNLTDSGSLFEAQTSHTVCGVLFSLAWVALGFLLYSDNHRRGAGPLDSVLR